MQFSERNQQKTVTLIYKSKHKITYKIRKKVEYLKHVISYFQHNAQFYFFPIFIFVKYNFSSIINIRKLYEGEKKWQKQSVLIIRKAE